MVTAAPIPKTTILLAIVEYLGVIWTPFIIFVFNGGAVEDGVGIDFCSSFVVKIVVHKAKNRTCNAWIAILSESIGNAAPITGFGNLKSTHRKIRAIVKPFARE
jgi:hypothetical protein